MKYLQEFFKRHFLQILTIGLLAFLVRYLLVWYLVGLNWQYNTGDGYETASLLQFIASNNTYRPPGQYLFAGLINDFAHGPNFFYLRIITMLCSALICINTYRMGRELFSKKVGIVAGYGAAFSPCLIYHAWTFYPTTLATCLCSFSLLYHFRSLKNPANKNTMLCGMLWGLTILTRPNTIIFPLFLFFWTLISGMGKGERGKIFSKISLFCLAIILSWTVRNYVVSKKLVLVSSNASVNFSIGNNPLQTGRYFLPESPQKTGRASIKEALLYNLTHPGWAAYFFKKKFQLYWSSHTWEHPRQLISTQFQQSPTRIYNPYFKGSRLEKWLSLKNKHIYKGIATCYGVFIAVCWGLIFAGLLFGMPDSRELWPICFIVVFNGLLFSFFFPGENRFFIPVLPYLFILLAVGVISLTNLLCMDVTQWKQLMVRRWFFLALIILGIYAMPKIFLDNPVKISEPFYPLKSWNVMVQQKKAATVLLAASQLSYPVKKEYLDRKFFSIQLNGTEVPYRTDKNWNPDNLSFRFHHLENFLCKDFIILYIPGSHPLVQSAPPLGKGKRIYLYNNLREKIVASYVPCWTLKPFCDRLRKKVIAVLKQL